MKATNTNSRANRLATVLFTVTMFGAAVSAQTNASVNANAADEAQKRLNALMVSTEVAIKYDAGSYEAAEFSGAIERLDVLASNIEAEIRYRTSEEGQGSAVEYAVWENNREEGAAEVWQTVLLTQKLSK